MIVNNEVENYPPKMKPKKCDNGTFCNSKGLNPAIAMHTLITFGLHSLGRRQDTAHKDQLSCLIVIKKVRGTEETLGNHITSALFSSLGMHSTRICSSRDQLGCEKQ